MAVCPVVRLGVMRKLLMLGLLLWGTAGSANMTRPTLVAWERLLIATDGYENACPGYQSKPVRCGIVDVPFTVFRSLMAVRPQFVQVQAWRAKGDDVYTARYKVGSKICLMVVAVTTPSQLAVVFSEVP